MELVKKLFDQPYWIMLLLAGVFFVSYPTITVDKNYTWITHAPTTQLPIWVGVGLLGLSIVCFCWMHVRALEVAQTNAAVGLDLSRVTETADALCTTVGSCEIRVVYGRIDSHAHNDGTTVVLPCNEYFDDRCANDTRSALGAFVNRVFDGQADNFISLIRKECKKKFKDGFETQKTDTERAISFGVAQCLLLVRPLDRAISVALVSTTTQRAGEGLACRVSYLFEAMRRLVSCLADARITDVVMPLLGSGHGGIDPPLSLVGLLLAIAEAARYGQGGQRLRKVTIIIYQRDAADNGQVDRTVVRRALALVGERN